MLSKENGFKLSSLLAGVTGEYYVAAELSKQGFIASITMRNTKGVDILCSNSEANKQVSIQVKTSKGKRRDWILNKKAEDFMDERHFYVFVNLNDGLGSPDYFIVPSKEVAEYVFSEHDEWLRKLGRNNRPHIETPIRKFRDVDELYKNRWDLLGLSS